MARRLVLIGLAVAVTALSGAAVWRLDPFGHSIPERLRACEAALGDRLVSPSSYRRIGFRGGGEQPLTLDAWNRLQHRPGDPAIPSMPEDIRAGRGGVFEEFVLTQDASNPMGVALRRMVLCDVLADGRYTDTEVFLDGVDGLDWIVAHASP